MPDGLVKPNRLTSPKERQKQMVIVNTEGLYLSGTAPISFMRDTSDTDTVLIKGTSKNSF